MGVVELIDMTVKKSGLSESIVRAVIKGVIEASQETLKHGKTATIPGLCTMTPDIRMKLEVVNGVSKPVNYIKVNTKPTSSFEKGLTGIGGFIDDEEDEAEEIGDDVRIIQIAGLV